MIPIFVLKATFDGLTGIVSFVEGRRSKFKIDILKLKQDVIQKVGYWQPDVGVNISDPSAFYDSNIANITLVVMTREVSEYVEYIWGFKKWILNATVFNRFL